MVIPLFCCYSVITVNNNIKNINTMFLFNWNNE